jgi:hypothetical protein
MPATRDVQSPDGARYKFPRCREERDKGGATPGERMRKQRARVAVEERLYLKAGVAVEERPFRAASSQADLSGL